ncbi:MAG: hypothetical protein LBT95_02150 [Treponema sp.]|jgi:hypothetical protein|nr:hypothetical protein [Treponema sp.]
MNKARKYKAHRRTENLVKALFGDIRKIRKIRIIGKTAHTDIVLYAPPELININVVFSDDPAGPTTGQVPPIPAM